MMETETTSFETSRPRLQWFREARFGMFIHWGIYSLLGRGEWVRFQEAIPQVEYEKLAQQFDPSAFDANAWARLARDAGMRYMVLTTKHHDGFCLFDSRYTDFTSAKTAAERDFVAEYVEAGRRAGLGIGLYFSLKDWRFPAYFEGPDRNASGWRELVEFVHAQVRELMTNYGKIDILWYDGSDDPNFRREFSGRGAEIWRSDELNAMARKLQPEILINDRSGMAGDFGTPEQTIDMTRDPDRINETCMTMNNHWGYCPADLEYKSTRELLHQLVICATRGNNYLLNMGPDADGVMPIIGVQRLREIGQWLKVFGEAIYGTDRALPAWWNYTSTGQLTTKGMTAYLIVEYWPGTSEIAFQSLRNEVLSATLLPTGECLKVERKGRTIAISGLPQCPPTVPFSVIKLDLGGRPEAQFHY